MWSLQSFNVSEYFCHDLKKLLFWSYNKIVNSNLLSYFVLNNSLSVYYSVHSLRNLLIMRDLSCALEGDQECSKGTFFTNVCFQLENVVTDIHYIVKDLTRCSNCHILSNRFSVLYNNFKLIFTI